MMKLNEDKILTMLANGTKEDIKQYILEQIKLNSCSSSTEKQQIKHFISMAKKFKKANKDSISSFAGAFIQDEFINICDGYRLISFKDTSIVCDMVDEGLKLIEADKIYLTDQSKAIEITLDIDDIMAFYKLYKARDKSINLQKKNSLENPSHYIIRDENQEILTTINIEYLHDMIKIFNVEDCKILYTGKASPLFFIDQATGNKGLVLPIRFVEYDIK